MVLITKDLVRKKAEHNEMMIGNLEELSLHQENVEKMEHLHDWCRELKILLMQSNLIPKIENVFKFKKLEYFNLAINNIERIENLEELESLQKLDLTLNFIGELTSVDSLKENYNLSELNLTGNPCTDYEFYRDYVITVLPQLKTLDGVEITITDRLLAKKDFDNKRKKIVQREAEYKIKRDEQKIRIQLRREQDEIELANLTEDERNKKFWEAKSEHCPETRIEIANKHKEREKVDLAEKKETRVVKLFAPCGRPYSVNQPKLEFTLLDEKDRYELDLAVYKFLDTSLIDVDVQPNYVRVTVKNKVFQMALTEEVRVAESTSQRSTTTGRLLIKLPKLNYKAITVTKTENQHQKPKNRSESELKPVNLMSICNPSYELNKIDITESVDESEIPDLI